MPCRIRIIFFLWTQGAQHCGRSAVHSTRLWPETFWVLLDEITQMRISPSPIGVSRNRHAHDLRTLRMASGISSVFAISAERVRAWPWHRVVRIGVDHLDHVPGNRIAAC
jgi:hypothetical protein